MKLQFDKVILKTLFVFFLVNSGVMLFGQAGFTLKKLPANLSSVGSGRNGDVSQIIENNIYSYKKSIATVCKFNGSGWANYPVQNVFTSTVSSISTTGNFIYLGGNHIHKTLQKRFGLLRFNGTIWDSIPSSEGCTIKDMTVFQNELYVLEDSGALGNTCRITRYNSDGSRTYLTPDENLCFNKIAVFNNTLCVFGASTPPIMHYVAGLGFVQGLANFNKISALSPVNNSQLAAVADNQGQKLIAIFSSADSYSDITYNFDKTYFPSVNSFSANGRYIYTGLSNINQDSIYFCDTLNKIWKWQSTNTSIGNYYFTGGNNGVVYFYDSSVNERKSNVYKLVRGNSLSGSVVFDRDKSCDVNLPDVPLKIFPIIATDKSGVEFRFYSDINGNYGIVLPPGKYKFKSALANSTISPCIDSFNIKEDVAQFDFTILVQVANLNTDLYTKITPVTSGFRARQGFNETYNVSYGNLGAVSDSLILTVKIPSQLVYVSSSVTPFSNVSNTLVYKFYNLEWNDGGNIKIVVNVPVPVSLGTILTFTSDISVNPTADFNLKNNNDTLNQKVVSGFDPNFKECTPSGKIPPGLAEIYYMIHFQNLGTDTAYGVTVIDTISSKLPLNFIQVIATSHLSQYSLKVINNALIWDFQNIKLPPLEQNEPESQGWVYFKMNVKPGLLHGDSITNKAYIYFDYQPPVITNDAKVLFVLTVGIPFISSKINDRITVYPNPSNGDFTVTCKGSGLVELGLFDISGKSIYSYKVQAGIEQNINTQGLSPGIYLLREKVSGSSVKLIIE
ncbi:MAG: T9SS type A sorting domain-containing protein [Bacteroidia bacterium]|nr:T9SS type A sorting domain-containing protein [Bacteroidia bacterium]